MTPDWPARGIRRVLRLALRRPGRAPGDIDEEVRFHITERVDQLVARGWAREEACREAERRFGPIDDTRRALHSAARNREETLRMRDSIRDSLLDVRVAARVLRRHPAFAITSAFTLALGIGAASSMFAVVKHSVLDPLPFAWQDRLVFIGEQFKPGQSMQVSYPNFVDWRERNHSFDGLEAVSYVNTGPVLGAGEPMIGRIQNVSRGLFPLLGIKPTIGRWIAANENAPDADATVMVSEAFWREHLGAKRDLSSLRIVVGGTPRAVVGVMPNTFRLLGSADVWFPLEIDPVRIRGAGNYWVIGRLRSGVSLNAATSELNAIARDLKATYGDESVSSAVESEWLTDVVIGSAKKPLLVLLGASLFVLVATCASVAMMILARGSARSQETAVRIALGSGWWRVVRAALVETALVVSAGSVGGVGIAWAGIGLVRKFGVGQVPRLNEVTLDGSVTLFAIAVAATATLLFSVIPARAARLAAIGRVSRPSRSWTVLIGAQAAVAVMLTVGAALVTRTISNVLNARIGYDPHGVAFGVIPLTSERYADDAVRERVGTELQRQVAAMIRGSVVGLASALPTDHGSGNGPLLLPPVVNPNSQKEWAAIASTRSVTPEYFRALRIPLVRGRMFTADDRDGTPDVALVNEALATRLWPGQNPIGKQVRALVDRRGALFTVVGVVGGAHDWRVPAASQIELYVPFAQRASTYVDVVVRSTSPTSTVNAALRSVAHTMDASLPLRFNTLEANLSDTMADKRFVGGLLVAFAATVVLLTAVGVFGAVSYAVSMLTREIGIRMAVGATPGRVWRSFEGGVLRTAAVGTGVGGVGGWYASKALAGLLYGTTPHDSASLALAVGVVCAATVCAAAIPAWKAARTDPATALRAG
jgi:putative ABC transport system permease protein